MLELEEVENDHKYDLSPRLSKEMEIWHHRAGQSGASVLRGVSTWVILIALATETPSETRLFTWSDMKLLPRLYKERKTCA
jgi:hypothetical protein